MDGRATPTMETSRASRNRAPHSTTRRPHRRGLQRLPAGLGGAAGSGLAERGAAGPGLAERGAGGPGLAERGAAGPGLAERGAAGPGLAERGAAGPGLAERGAAGPGLAPVVAEFMSPTLCMHEH